MSKLPNPKLKDINLGESHASLGSASKSNFSEIEKYLSNHNERIDDLEENSGNNIGLGDDDIVNIVNAVRSSMVKIIPLSATHTDGVTTLLDNNCTVTRSGNKFIIQTPSAIEYSPIGLRDATTKSYASAYDVKIDNTNQIIVSFSPFIKQNLELILFG
ncbi:hypothetical protein BPT24_224 [Tenacibaculum phage pT24]|uniref:Uncharacterized protein n=1 Tax=Tenacibaculum phage pT24 TaxID=1880590 RepID=A0A1W7GKQ6_9CAUD|nr:hypothetical protein HYP10_gp224 [Tenacibaculum phage pT24]BAX25561.1 hypothetical protein BPT24_224 [Tenacibaculum phage pT24]